MDIRFQKPCDPEQLTGLIIAGGLPQGERFYGTSCEVDDGVTIIHVPDDITTEERAIIDNVVNAYDGLNQLRSQALTKLHGDCTNYILSHYDTPRQASLNALLTEATILGYTNRIQYIAQALAWIKGCITYYYTKQDAIEASTTEEELAAVVWNFHEEFSASDPNISLREAQNMTN